VPHISQPRIPGPVLIKVHAAHDQLLAGPGEAAASVQGLVGGGGDDAMAGDGATATAGAAGVGFVGQGPGGGNRPSKRLPIVWATWTEVLHTSIQSKPSRNAGRRSWLSILARTPSPLGPCTPPSWLRRFRTRSCSSAEEMSNRTPKTVAPAPRPSLIHGARWSSSKLQRSITGDFPASRTSRAADRQASRVPRVSWFTRTKH